MESYIKIKATVPEMSKFFEKDNGVRHYEIKDKRYTQAELDAMPEDKYNSEVFAFSVCYRHTELEKPLTGTFTIAGLTEKMDAFREADSLLHTRQSIKTTQSMPLSMTNCPPTGNPFA